MWTVRRSSVTAAALLAPSRKKTRTRLRALLASVRTLVTLRTLVTRCAARMTTVQRFLPVRAAASGATAGRAARCAARPTSASSAPQRLTAQPPATSTASTNAITSRETERRTSACWPARVAGCRCARPPIYDMSVCASTLTGPTPLASLSALLPLTSAAPLRRLSHRRSPARPAA